VARPYATPGYLASIGGPTRARDLGAATFMGFDRSERMTAHLAQMGVPTGPENFSIVCENHLVQWELAKVGAGICFVMEEVGDAEPRVVRVASDFPPLPVPLWLVTHREVATSRRIRVVFDMLAAALSP
jgi:DNA-binding transcriptional LysR family regulator